MKRSEGAIIIENPNVRDRTTEGEQYLLEKLKNSKTFTGWTLYEEPIINSMKPDFVLLHPEKGIIIIEVKDWHLNSPQYLNNAKVLDNKGKYITRNPVDQVMSYKELLIKYELTSYIEALDIYSNKAYGMVTPIVYFHKASREKAESFCNTDSQKCLIWSKEDLDELCRGTKKDDERFPAAIFYQRSLFAKHPDYSMQNLVENLENILRPSDYALGRKVPLILSNEQKSLVPIQPNSVRRWGGVAGSGKTVIIATKAVEAIKKGERVLILTFNITLRHYIRDLCSQQFGEGKRRLLKSNLTITHFHGFLKILLTELNLLTELKSKRKSNLNNSVENYTNCGINLILKEINNDLPEHLKYDSILIDEGQDFSGDWIRYLKNFFTSKGELLVMYDEAQSIYEGKGVWITDPNEIAGIGFKGRVGHLSITHRLPNAIINQIYRLSHLFGNKKELRSSNQQLDLFTENNWINVNIDDNRTHLIEQIIKEIINKKISTIEDITVLTMHESTGVQVVKRFTELGQRVSHVYDLNNKGNYEMRRDEKFKFQPGKNCLKVSSYHSYKGWESSHIILLLEEVGNQSENHDIVKQRMLEALYISLTRVNGFSESRSFTCINNSQMFYSLKKYF